MSFDRTKCLKQPSVLTFQSEILGFTNAGFSLDLNPQLDEEYSEEWPTIPIMRHVVGMSPLLLVSLLQVDEGTLKAAFGGFIDGDEISFPGSITPGEDIYTDDKWTGDLSLEPRSGQRGIYITGGNVQPIITNAIRLSVLDRVILSVAFMFQFDQSMNVIDVEFRSL